MERFFLLMEISVEEVNNEIDDSDPRYGDSMLLDYVQEFWDKYESGNLKYKKKFTPSSDILELMYFVMDPASFKMNWSQFPPLKEDAMNNDDQYKIIWNHKFEYYYDGDYEEFLEPIRRYKNLAQFLDQYENKCTEWKKAGICQTNSVSDP